MINLVGRKGKSLYGEKHNELHLLNNEMYVFHLILWLNMAFKDISLCWIRNTVLQRDRRHGDKCPLPIAPYKLQRTSSF